MSERLKYLKEKAQEIRQQVLDMCVGAGTGHVTSSFSSTEILVSLYHGGILRTDPSRPDWEERDRFILSKGQASPLLYVVLADLGFFPQRNLKKFCCTDGPFGVHLQHDVAGVEMTSGSLGHGLGVGAGIALAAKMDEKPQMVFALLGDGECYEGSIWESALFAAHHQLTNLVAIVDRNKLCVTDFTENIVRLNPLAKKWESFGWEAVEVDGHSIKELLTVLKRVRSRRSTRPLVIIANTVKGKGVSFLEDVVLWHGVAPQGKEALRAKKELQGRR